MRILAIAFTALFFAITARATTQPDDCTLRFTGSYRLAIKLRSPNQHYQKYNHGQPIDLTEWFALTNRLSQGLGTSGSSIPKDQVIKNVEDIQVKLRAFILAVRFERNTKPKDGKDNELHVELGGSPQWKTPHAIVEVATGEDFCSVRKTIWNLAAKDAQVDGKHASTLRIFSDPPEVLITGYIFVDGTHAHKAMTPTKWSQDSGGRGIHIKKNFPSQVRGLFEIHPVTSVALAH